MKKLVFAAVVFVMVCFSMMGCNDNYINESSEKKTEVSQEKNNDTEQKENLKVKNYGKFEGEIYSATPFSNGLSLISPSEFSEEIYCVDKEGNIKFAIPAETGKSGVRWKAFENGISYNYLDNNKLLDVNGKIHLPEEYEMTAFYYYALDSGYIIAENNTGDVKKIGIMDVNFNWVLEPTVEIYNTLSPILSETHGIEYDPTDGNYFDVGDDSWFDMTTGEIVEKTNYVMPSERWYFVTSWGYYEFLTGDFDNSLILPCSEHDVSYSLQPYGFINGLCILPLYDPETELISFTAVNEKGEHTFEPVVVDDDITKKKWSFITDGKKYIIGGDGMQNPLNISANEIKSYDIFGNIYGEMTLKGKSSIYLSDEVITVVDSENKYAMHLDPETLTELF